MYLSYEQVTATNAIRTVTQLTVPANATHAELLADTQDVRYTMDGTTNPSQTSGMILKVGDEPKLFLIEDLRQIRFTRVAAGNGLLNIHYAGGRDI